MAAENTTKDDMDKLIKNLSSTLRLAEKDEEKRVEEKSDDEKDLDLLQIIAKALEDILRKWGCNALKCGKNMRDTRWIYKTTLGNKSRRPDFRDKTVQFGYMFMFMLNHSYLLFYSIKKAVEANNININPEENPLNVCVIGGGPGSDILGLCMLLNEKNCMKPWFRQVNVLDKFVEWEESWKQISEHLPEHLKETIGNVTYSQFDFTTEALDESNQERIKDAHVVTMTKALSCAAAWLKDLPPKSGERPVETKRNSVFSILDKMRNGAILLYLDNKLGEQRRILLSAAEQLEFEVLYEDSINVNVPEYYKFIGGNLRKSMPYLNPSRGSNEETFIILQKPGELSEKVKLEANLQKIVQAESSKAEAICTTL